MPQRHPDRDAAPCTPARTPLAPAQAIGPVPREALTPARDPGTLSPTRLAPAQDIGPVPRETLAPARDRGTLSRTSLAHAQDIGPVPREALDPARDRGTLSRTSLAPAQAVGRVPRAVRAAARVGGTPFRALFAAALALGLAGPAAATQEYILPTLFDVTGVSADDVLNIRARPDARSPVIGTLAPDAERIEVVAHDPSGAWAQVNTRERDGWVALRYLAYRTDVWEQGELPATLHCFGNEPFWSLRPSGEALVLARPGVPDLGLPLGAVLDTGVFRTPRRAVTAGAAGGDGAPGADAGLVAAIVPLACSDGMSDRAYGLDASVVLTQAGGSELLTGCCSIAPR